MPENSSFPCSESDGMFTLVFRLLLRVVPRPRERSLKQKSPRADRIRTPPTTPPTTPPFAPGDKPSSEETCPIGDDVAVGKIVIVGGFDGLWKIVLVADVTEFARAVIGIVILVSTRFQIEDGYVTGFVAIPGIAVGKYRYTYKRN